MGVGGPASSEKAAKRCTERNWTVGPTLEKMDERLFTLAEANDLLPRLRTLLEDAGVEWRRMRDLNPEIQKVRDKAPMDAFSPYGVEYVNSLSRLLYFLHQIKELGVLLKDVDQGLCDFPYKR